MEHHGSADVQGLCDIVDGVAAVISADEHILLTFRESADEVLNRLFQYDFIVLFFNAAFSGNAFRKLVKACGVFGWNPLLTNLFFVSVKSQVPHDFGNIRFEVFWIVGWDVFPKLQVRIVNALRAVLVIRENVEGNRMEIFSVL